MEADLNVAHRAPLFAAALVLLSATCARCATFDAELKLSAGKHERTVKSSKTAAGKPPERRAAVDGAVGGQFTASCKITRAAKDEAKDVLVHFYVVRIDRAGEAPPPLEPSKVAIEGAWTMDFPPGETTSARLPFRIDEPGIFLVRLEARPNADDAATDTFVELDLIVK